MSTFYANLAKVALRLLRAKGQTMYLIRRTAGAYNVTTSSATSTETREAVYGVEFALPAREQQDQSVQSADKGVYIEAVSPTRDPETYDALEIGGVTHEIISAAPLSPAGLAVLHELRVRRGG